MKKPFEELFGNRVFLEIPKIPESNILLSDEAQRVWIEEQKLSLNKFKVYAVGDDVTKVKEGDEVAVDMQALSRAQVFRLTKEIEVLPISVFDISLRW